MDDWAYCRETLPKVSRTFALNIAVLKGSLHRSVLTAYLFCRIVDTIEDAACLHPKMKTSLLQEFARLLADPSNRAAALAGWVRDTAQVDGSPSDLDLLANTARVFRVFDSLPENHRDQIVPSVVRMAQGMAHFQGKFDAAGISTLADESELEEYCYFVAGVVGEMLCNLFLQELEGLPPAARRTMQRTAVSFGLGLQMTNICKDVVVDRGRRWSYIPRSYIMQQGLSVEEFSSGGNEEKSMQVLNRLLHKTLGHLEDALEFTLAIPAKAQTLRLFCIWPLWMALETVAVLHNNPALLQSGDPVKISRQAVRRILRRTRLMCFSDLLLKWSFGEIRKRTRLAHPPGFELDELKERLDRLGLNPSPVGADGVKS